MALPPVQKLALLSDPVKRAHLESLAAVTTQMKSLAAWNEKVIVETFTPETEPYRGRLVADIAAEKGQSPFDALIDIVVADGLRTSIGGTDRETTDTAEDWAWRRELWLDPRTVVGGSDAGAHLDGLATFSFATELLAEGVRRQQLISTEEAVHLLTRSRRPSMGCLTGAASGGGRSRPRRLRRICSRSGGGHDKVRPAGRRRSPVRRG